MKIRNISTIVGLLVILLTIPLFTHFRAKQLAEPKPLVETIESSVSLEWAKVLYLGYNAFAADFLMTKLQYYYGSHYVTDRSYPLVAQMVKVVVTLNHTLADPFIPFGDAALTSMGTRSAVTEANDLLAFGHTIDPDNYKFVFNQGYNYYFSLDDPTLAYKLMYEGAQMKGAPKRLYWLVSKVIANSGSYELGLFYTQEKLKTAKDKHMKKQFNMRILLFKNLIALSNIAKEYEKKYDKKPDESLSVFIKARYLSSLPKDPYGGEYKYNKEKDIVYSTSAKDGFFVTRGKKKEEMKTGIKSNN